MYCDACGKGHEEIDKKNFGGADIARYTMSVNKTECKKFMPGVSWGICLTDGVAYHGPEFSESKDLCHECYKTIKENFTKVFERSEAP